MKAALVAGGHGDQGVVDVGLRLHLAELFVTELRNVAAGKDEVDIGCDPERDNEANGGAPNRVFERNGRRTVRRSSREEPVPIQARAAPRHARAARGVGAQLLRCGTSTNSAQARARHGFRRGGGWRRRWCAAAFFADEDADEDGGAMPRWR